MARTEERDAIAARVADYLAAASADRTISLSYEAVARGARTSRGHFAEPEYAAVVRQILDARAARRVRPAHRTATGEMGHGSAADGAPGAGDGAAAGTSDGEGGAAEALPDADLEARLRYHAAEARYAMLGWLSLHKEQEPVAEAPLLLADLERTLAALRREADALRPLVAEHQHRLERSHRPGSMPGDAAAPPHDPAPPQLWPGVPD